MPSLMTWDKLSKHDSIDVRDAYNRLDTLASEEDLQALYEVLTSVRDRNGKPAVLTANCVMANPDFAAIRKNNYQSYHYELLNKTFARYNLSGSLQMWQEGIEAGIFMPQFHGREHVNIAAWLYNLQSGHRGVRMAFEEEVFGASFSGLEQRKSNFQAAWDYRSKEERQIVAESIREGLQCFRDYFGFCSHTAIAPSYTWSESLEKVLLSAGVTYLQTISRAVLLKEEEEKYQRPFKYTSKATSRKMGYLLRNAFFEPANHKYQPQLKNVLKRIGIAFRLGKPAIISSHRLNFIGSLQEKNRTGNLRELQRLLKEAVVRWPDLEFISTADLVKFMER